MKLIVGLGNPGVSYQWTRHNAGALAVEKLAKQYQWKFEKNRSFNSLIAKGRIGDGEVFLVLPQTFMNLSGDAVASFVQKKAIALKDILIVCDDVALPLGIIRLRPDGSGGGHNGLVSVIGRLGTKEFARLRLGIGGRTDGGELSGYVLGSFEKDERPILNETFAQSVEAMGTWVREGIDVAMRRFNKTKNQFDKERTNKAGIEEKKQYE